MKSQPKSDLKILFTEGNEGNEKRRLPEGRAPTNHASRGGAPRNSLRYLRPLLFIFPVAAAVLLPTDAQAQAIEAWVRLSGIPNPTQSQQSNAGLAVDVSGNVVVSGSSWGGEASSDDWLTIKYSGAGTPLWTNRYDGPGSGRDLPTAVAVDGSGNVYVTGVTDLYDYGRPWPPNANSTTIKYSSSGVPLWTNSYDGSAHGSDAANAITVDASQNVIVTGRSWNGANYDCLTIKYSSTGLALWTNLYNAPANGDDRGAQVRVDASGNVSVLGYGAGGLFRIKYTSAGALTQARTYAGSAYTIMFCAEDHGGNVILTGYLQRPTTGLDFVAVKYSSAGVPLWTNYYNGPVADGSDIANAVVVDANNDVYVTGESQGTTTYSDYATIKYSSAGVPLWTNRYSGLGMNTAFNRPWGLPLDASGNLIVTGRSTGTIGIQIESMDDFATIAYSSSGVPLWTNRYNGPANKPDRVCNLAVDASNNVYVVGYSATSDWSVNTQSVVLATIKYVVPPIIFRQPLSCTNTIGTIAGFSVEVAGGLPLNYQWRRGGTNLVDGGNLSGVTTTNLMIANVQLTDAAGYSVVVTNAYGSVTSSLAQLTVTIPPSPGRFTNFKYSPDTGLSFVFRDATVGQSYRIQRSPSVAEGSWVDWESFTYAGPKGLMDVSATGAERRFYRAISP